MNRFHLLAIRLMAGPNGAGGAIKFALINQKNNDFTILNHVFI